jgi:hypothetical protein
LEDFTRVEVVARGSFRSKVVDDCLNFRLFESVEGGSSWQGDSKRRTRGSSSSGKLVGCGWKTDAKWLAKA